MRRTDSAWRHLRLSRGDAATERAHLRNLRLEDIARDDGAHARRRPRHEDVTPLEGHDLRRGSEKLRPLSETLKSANYPTRFPDDTPTKIVRRGTLSCAPETGCTFVLLLPENVTSVE